MFFDITEVRASTYGAINIYLSSVFTLISFCTPYWLASDGQISLESNFIILLIFFSFFSFEFTGRQPVKHFNNLGLWTVCFSSFYHPNYLYDKEFKGCRWLFDEDYSFLSSILEPRKFNPIK